MAVGQKYVVMYSFILGITLMLVWSTKTLASDIQIKSDAPDQYVVKKGDTLWDISNIFLQKAWLWPELWRNNTQIENPHLIYPGDVLRLRYENGVPVLEIVRDKKQLVLSPQETIRQKPEPISVLPWAIIDKYINGDVLMSEKQYDALPSVLGDKAGTPRFTDADFVVAYELDSKIDEYQVIRKGEYVKDYYGNELGMQIRHVADAILTDSVSDNRHVLSITSSIFEAKQGDKLLPFDTKRNRDLQLKSANSQQVGRVVKNIANNILSGPFDIVIIDLGNDIVEPGTVFGIYQRGPDIMYRDGSTPKYAKTLPSPIDLIRLDKRVEQPAQKVGELVVVKSFENASFAWITKVNEYLQGGELIASP